MKKLLCILFGLVLFISCDEREITRNVAELNERFAFGTIGHAVLAFGTDGIFAAIIAVIFAIADFIGTGINETVGIVGIALITKAAFIQVFFFAFLEESVAVQIQTVADLIFADAATAFLCRYDAFAAFQTITVL